MALTQVNPAMLSGSSNTTTTIQSNGVTAITVDASQNVGIGTSTPSSKLSFGQTGSSQVGSQILLYDGGSASNTNNYGFAMNPATGELSTSAGVSGYITWYTGTRSERMRIDSSGKLLIGMTSYSAFANGVATYSDANGAVLNLGHTTGSGNGAGFVLFGYNNGGIGSITQNGTTAVAYNTTSDYRLKTDVTPIQDALATVEALNPVSFTWIDGRPDDGFLAHEIQAVIPNCVTGEKDAVNEDGAPKYQQMDSSGVIPFLVKAIQELNAKVDAQAAEIKALKG